MARFKEGDKVWITLKALIIKDSSKMENGSMCYEVYVDDLGEDTFLIEGDDEFEIKQRK